MIKKGICSTCSNDKDCTFPRKFPVWQCEEFNGYEIKISRKDYLRKVKKTQKKQAIPVIQR